LTYTKSLTLWPLGGPQCEPCEDFLDFADFGCLCVANVGSWVRAEFGRLSEFAPPGHRLRCLNSENFTIRRARSSPGAAIYLLQADFETLRRVFDRLADHLGTENLN
jgi:hypothetical protein